MDKRRVGVVVAALTLTLAGCASKGSPATDSPPANALVITSATQLARAVGCTNYQPSAPTGFTEGGDCTIDGVAFHLYVFASNSDRNTLVNGIFKTSADLKYAIGDKYTIASLDDATIRTAAAEIGAVVQ